MAKTPDDDSNEAKLCGNLTFFSESAEIEEIVKSLVDCCANSGEFEIQKEKYMKILDEYQAQPHLLDPYLPTMLQQLLDLILNEESNVDLTNAAAAFAAHLVKVRGYKVVVRHLPHEVKYFEAVMHLLEKSSSGCWETEYFLLLWLSILVLIPFHLSRFDSKVEGQISLMDRVLHQIKRSVIRGDKCQDAASFLSAKFLTRPEIVGQYLPEYLDWALLIVSKQTMDRTDDIAKIGVLSSLAAIYKHGKREDFLQYAPTVLKIVQENQLGSNPNVIIQKLGVKLMQRLGLIFLKAKVATWRYQRGSRSLALAFDTSKKDVPEVSQDVVEDDEDYEVPDEIEEVIEYLLEGLRSSDTIIRWSAAKGIGRVTGRLPKELADDVVASLLQLLSLKESDSAWHGGCLSLAELARRGLLLPKRLDEVMDVVLKALVYDERRGCFSVGAHVRDAACYVCWAFARAYTPAVLQPYIPSMVAPALLVTSVFDREVNCRRAASAAFQENVGRLGADSVPHGIDLLTTCDYHSVGVRSIAFTELSVKVAEKSESYAAKMIEHLLEKKVNHWDSSVRELTGQAFRNLTPIATRLMVERAIPDLLNNLDCSKDLYTKHGSLVAVGNIVAGIWDVAMKEGKTISDYLDEAMLIRVKNILMVMEQRLELRGSGGELLRSAVAPFIQNMAQAHFPCHDDEEIIDLWKIILDDNIVHRDPTIQERAVAAVPYFVSEYYSSEKVEDLFLHYTSQLNSSESHRRGFSLALGALPKSVLESRLDRLLPILIDKTAITPSTEVWAEGRRDVIKAIINVVKTVGVASKLAKVESSIGDANSVLIYECFLKALDDYTHDRRGDIGAWVREAAMSGLAALTVILASSGDASFVPQVCIEAMMPKIAQQACEKIDRTRGHAAHIFASLLTHPDVPHVPRRAEVLDCFPPKIRSKGHEFDEFGWTVESETFPIFAKLLRLPEYSSNVLIGFIVSVGGVTERLVRQSSQNLFRELESMTAEELASFGAKLAKIFSTYQKVDRITLPLLKCLDQLLTSGLLEALLSTSFAFEIFTLTKTEITKCGEPNKLVASIDVFCNLLQSEFESTASKCLVQLSIFLCHKFPRIRKVTAQKLFETLLLYDGVLPDEEKREEVNSILSDTNWDLPIEDLRPIRNRFCEVVGVQPPALIKKPL